MTRFLVGRILRGLVVMLGVSTLVFVLMYLTGDPTNVMVPEDATLQQRAEIRSRMGFDRPIPEQYILFLSRAASGDFGYSYRIKRPAFDLVVERLPATLALTFAAIGFALLWATPLGLVAAVRRNSFVDRLCTVGVLFGQSFPTFWFGTMAILVVSVNLGWLPTSGFRGPQYLILPAVTLGLDAAATIARLLRSSLASALAADYIRTARAKGLVERIVLVRHALRNASIPVITILGLQMGFLLGGSVVTETVFSYPGMGLLVIQAIRGRDMPVVQAFVLFIAVVIVMLTFAVDLLYTQLDPRIRVRP